jgi:hypothetical protein
MDGVVSSAMQGAEAMDIHTISEGRFISVLL